MNHFALIVWTRWGRKMFSRKEGMAGRRLKSLSKTMALSNPLPVSTDFLSWEWCRRSPSPIRYSYHGTIRCCSILQGLPSNMPAVFMQTVKGQKNWIGEELSSWEIYSTKYQFEKRGRKKSHIKSLYRQWRAWAVEVSYFILVYTVCKAISSLRKWCVYWTQSYLSF